MMAMTTSNSMRVNADLEARQGAEEALGSVSVVGYILMFGPKNNGLLIGPIHFDAVCFD
jgi:hypothetical protein